MKALGGSQLTISGWDRSNAQAATARADSGAHSHQATAGTCIGMDPVEDACASQAAYDKSGITESYKVILIRTKGKLYHPSVPEALLMYGIKRKLQFRHIQTLSCAFLDDA